MSDEELAAIRERRDEMLAAHEGKFCQDCDDISVLLDEIELLRRDHADGLKVTGIPHQGRVR